MIRAIARRQPRRTPPVAREHDAIGLRPVQPARLVGGAFEGADGAASTSSPPGTSRPTPAARGRARPSPSRARCARGCRAVAAGSPRCAVSNSALSQGVGSGVPGVTRSLHFSAAGSCSAVTFGSHGSGCRRRAGLVRDIRRVVLVGERGEVMAELVDEHVRRERAVDRRGRLIVEDAAAAVGPFVDQDLDELVGRGRRGVAQRPVVEREHVALGIEDVVFRRQRRAAEHAGIRAVDAALGRRQVQRAGR